MLSATDRIEEVSHPLGDDERQHDGHTERDVAGTLDNNHRETKRHPGCASQVCRCTDQRVLGYVRPLPSAQSRRHFHDVIITFIHNAAQKRTSVAFLE